MRFLGFVVKSKAWCPQAADNRFHVRRRVSMVIDRSRHGRMALIDLNSGPTQIPPGSAQPLDRNTGIRC